MQKYEQRLIKCGYTEDAAHKLCLDFLRNLSLNELEFFIVDLETRYVG